MALSNAEVAEKVVSFLTKYFNYNVQSETLTFDLASFNNNIQSYLAALRTDVMLAVGGDYDGAEDYIILGCSTTTFPTLPIPLLHLSTRLVTVFSDSISLNC